VTFLAILELAKESLIELVQAQPYTNIHIKMSGPVKYAEAELDG
jgi:segregation and condensation protein A